MSGNISSFPHWRFGADDACCIHLLRCAPRADMVGAVAGWLVALKGSGIILVWPFRSYHWRVIRQGTLSSVHVTAGH
ncbi:hypothetical protein GCM10009837_42100 [Streptomyces durmitorensis]